MNKPKIMLMGYARHGKDTVLDLLREVGFTAINSSEYVNKTAVFPTLSKLYGYQTPEECYADRVNHRAEWMQLINAYNTPDLARMSKGIFSECDIYAGIRNALEFRAARKAGLFDWAIWVDALDRIPPEKYESCTVTPTMADLIINNNGTVEQLPAAVNRILNLII
jgi:hypothetical protein